MTESEGTKVKKNTSITSFNIYAVLLVSYTGWGKRRFTVVCMENSTLLYNNMKINSVFHVLTTVNRLLPHPELIKCFTVYDNAISFDS